MSHFKERDEKICLNCKAEVAGRYCHICGQENREPKESVWGLINHFFSDITHFDSKFFGTARYLVSKPGFLPKQYIIGKRASYINPIRLYIFSSAIFFIIFFSVFDPSNMDYNNSGSNKVTDSVTMKLNFAKEQALKEADTRDDSAAIERAFAFTKLPIPVTVNIDTTSSKDSTSRKNKKPKRRIKVNETEESKTNWNLSLDNSNFTSKEQYDSVQNTLPAEKRDGWWKRKAAYRSIELTKRYKENGAQLWKDLLNKFIHSFPYILFVSLPLYALILKLLYIRRRKFYYVDHGMFLIYLYVFTFLFLLIWYGIIELQDKLNWGWLGFLQAAFIIYGIYYAYRAMYKFYEQGHGKTFLKFFLFNIISFISIIFLFGIFFTLTLFRI